MIYIANMWVFTIYCYVILTIYGEDPHVYYVILTIYGEDPHACYVNHDYIVMIYIANMWVLTIYSHDLQNKHAGLHHI
jgi:hypothetical protein